MLLQLGALFLGGVLVVLTILTVLRGHAIRRADLQEGRINSIWRFLLLHIFMIIFCAFGTMLVWASISYFL
ncbi:hypothetical protein DFP90_10249 [Aestuariispira insulae]|uniref:Uncharacterized protein n=1 Tax=Aestuariispira insulae TaxID=1461337 RepID=A0A3D9HRA3_9PROT|nr:hypothetical protein DFP90_10249 [Aestuariispira insulae]